MTDDRDPSAPYTGKEGSRISMAVEGLKAFFKESIYSHDGDVNLQLVGFGPNVLGTLNLSIAANSAERCNVLSGCAAG